MLGTKWPSITSRWIQSAPAASTARTSSPSLEKSEARIEGAITRGRGVNGDVMGAVSGSKGECEAVTCRPRSGNEGREKSARERHEMPGRLAGLQGKIPIFQAVSLWHAACDAAFGNTSPPPFGGNAGVLSCGLRLVQRPRSSTD